MSTWKNLELTIDGPVARLRLNRPSAMNALSRATLEELEAALAQIQSQERVRVMVLSGAGRAFSVGFDLMDMAATMQGGALPPEDELRANAAIGGRVITALRQMRAITIACAQGHAVGGGFLLLSACDFRVVTEETLFQLPEVDIGLPLIWGGVPLLYQELTPSLARDLMMTGRRFTHVDLKGTGFFHTVSRPGELASACGLLTEHLLAKPAPALRLLKAQCRETTEGPSTAASDAARFAEAVLHPDFLPTAMAYVQRLRQRKKDTNA